ncbi:MAG: alkaline phosphatase [Sutterella seckii]
MNKHILSAAAAAVLLSFSAASAVQAAQIYPVDQARFMTNARFDFKVELDTVVDRKNIQVQINGQDYKKVLKGDEIYVAEEIDAKGSAIILRDVEIKKPGKYTVTVKSPEGELRANWDIYTTPKKAVAKNVIILLADGLSVGHRTAARILSKGVTNGMYNAPLAMDDMPHMALLGTSSVDTIAADSANTASAYMTGHKSSVNALGVYADRTKASQDDPRQETIAEILRRKTGKAIGVVSDAEIEDATPASVVSHTRRRADKADIVGMFWDVRPDVILGGGSAYFLPQGVPGSKRKDQTNYIEMFKNDGYQFVTDRTELNDAVNVK